MTVEMTSMPGVEDLVDVLVALLVAQPGAFVCASSSTSASSGARADDGIDVHLLELERAVLDAQPRHDLEPFGERRRLRPVVRLEVADHDVTPLVLRLPALLQHPVGLADPGGLPSRIR